MTALYGDVVLDRFRRPHHRGRLDRPDGVAEDVNPLCGDRIRMEIQLDPGPGRVVGAVRFQGDACAIAVASADLLAELAEGRPAGDAERIDREAVLALLGASVRPARLACVTLPLTVFRRALAGGAPAR